MLSSSQLTPAWPSENGQQPLVELRHLSRHFVAPGGAPFRPRAVVRAVDEVSLSIRPGETIGLVGESGCGKSTLGRLVLGLIKPTAGQVLCGGLDVSRARGGDLRRLRRDMQIVFQDPHGSLDPQRTVRSAIREVLDVSEAVPRAEREAEVRRLLEAVGLLPVFAEHLPHQLSGGQAQRVAMARALATRPRFIVADEPVSSLDVSIRAQILNLLKELQEQLGLTYLFISHDLSVVEFLSDRVAVMYFGKLVELAPTRELFAEPLHPYTRALLASVPVPDPTVPRVPAPLAGELPNPLAPPPGCRFHPRCPIAVTECQTEAPTLREVRSGHFVACHLST